VSNVLVVARNVQVDWWNGSTTLTATGGNSARAVQFLRSRFPISCRSGSITTADHDGVRDSGRKSIPGVSFCNCRVQWHDRWQRTQTNDQGQYLFDTFASGSFTGIGRKTQPIGFNTTVSRPRRHDPRTPSVTALSTSSSDRGLTRRTSLAVRVCNGVGYDSVERKLRLVRRRVHVDLDEDCVLDPGD